MENAHFSRLNDLVGTHLLYMNLVFNAPERTEKRTKAARIAAETLQEATTKRTSRTQD